MVKTAFALDKADVVFISGKNALMWTLNFTCYSERHICIDVKRVEGNESRY